MQARPTLIRTDRCRDARARSLPPSRPAIAAGRPDRGRSSSCSPLRCVALALVPTYARETPGAVGLPVLLLVPAALGAHRAGADLRRLPADQARAGRSGERARPPRRRGPASTASSSASCCSSSSWSRSAGSWPRAGGGPASMDTLDEWGLGGRGFGTVDHLVPARRRPLHRLHLRRGAGGDVRHRRGQRLLRRAVHDPGLPDRLRVHAAAVVASRTGTATSRRPTSSAAATTAAALALAVAVTGILATMPYIALQLVGIQAVLDTMGLGGTGNAFVRDLPLIIAFAVLAAYTYSSGLRAPALIAFVKDTPDLPGDRRGDRLRRRARSASATCSTRPRPSWPRQAQDRAADRRRSSPSTDSYWAYGTLALRFGAGAVHVPALDDGGAVGQVAATSSGATPRSCRPTR